MVTTDSIIKEYVSIYGNDYDYSNVEYTNAKSEVKIHCNLCNIDFEQLPRVHKTSRGCKGCRARVLREKLGADQNEYINFCVNKFGNKFDYSLVEYKSAHEKIKVKCNTCNFVLTPTAHKHKNSKGKCSNCITHDKDSFIRNIKGVHKDGLYSYEKFKYIGYHEPSLIHCHNCNEYFPQSPSGHLRGHGCKDCNSHYLHGIDAYKNRSATLYYFKVGDYYKVGITVENVNRRYSNDPARVLFENVNEWFFNDGAKAYKLEKYFLIEYNKFRCEGVKILKGGNNELFSKDILSEIKEYISDKIN